MRLVVLGAFCLFGCASVKAVAKEVADVVPVKSIQFSPVVEANIMNAYESQGEYEFLCSYSGEHRAIRCVSQSELDQAIQRRKENRDL